MNLKLFKSISAVVLAAVLIMPSAGASLAASNNPDSSAAEIENKDEVIYANLASDGSVSAVHVVNHFEVTKAGIITEYGDYSSVVNLTDTGLLSQQDDSVTFDTQEGNFYYQGNMEATNLPWIFDISYYMNSVKTPPQELAGKSGKLEILIATTKNATVNPVFYDNYILQISMTLDSDKCSDVESSGATIARAGENMVIAHTVMPGKDADITLTATVNDFTMNGIDISAMPFSMDIDLPDTDDMVSDLEKLTDAISDLNDGVGDLLDGVADLKTGANGLKNGSSDIQQGLSQLSGNSGQLIEASTQIKDALSQIASSLSGGLSGDFDLNDLTRLPEGLTQLAQGLKDISDGLSGLKNAFLPAYQALDAAMQDIPDTSITPEQLPDLYEQTDPSQHALLDELVDSYKAGQTAKGTYNNVKGAFDAVGSTIDTLSGGIDTIAGTLDEMSESIGTALSGLDGLNQFGELASGLTALSQSYGDFHSGLTDYMGGFDDLAGGYADFHSGLTAFSRGVSELYNGVEDLHDGTGQLRDKTADMPDTMQTKIDDMLDEYTGSDFNPVSFTSPLNDKVDLVQFVFKCDGIKKQDEANEPVTEPEQETIWDRFVALFGGKEA